MAPTHGLRGLQVREPGHDHVDLALGAVARHRDELAQVPAEHDELRPEPHPGIRRHLVVAGPTRVQLARDRTDHLPESSLVGGVDVLVSVLHLERVGGPLLGNLPEALDEGIALVVGDDARLSERARVAHAAADVLLRHAAVEGQGLVELLHQRVDVLGEAASPQLLLLGRHRDETRASARRGRGRGAACARGEPGAGRYAGEGHVRDRQRHHAGAGGARRTAATESRARVLWHRR